MMKMPQTFWNGEPTLARRVLVVIGAAPVSTWWFHGLEGTKRRAVEVTYQGEVFYLDDEDGSGWAKVTKGRGSPHWGHKSLNIAKVLNAHDEKNCQYRRKK